MNPEETMVENEFDQAAADDTPQESMIEETDESEQSLDSYLEDEGQPAEEPKQTQPQGTSEPGWIKQRVNKAVQKAVAETEARMRSEFDAQMAPIRERLLNDEAKELVAQGEFKSLERAKEYLQLKQGQPVTSTPEKPKQPRNAQGQYASNDEDPGTSARIQMLSHQAERIRASGGPDVIAEFRNNPEVEKKVKAGEMDFYDVAEMLRQPGRKRPPAPMRSPNGVNGVGPDSIWAMTDEQFARMDKKLDEGVRFTIKK